MGFSRHEYWSGLPCPSPGDLFDPGIEPESLKSPALAGRIFTTSTTWKTVWRLLKTLKTEFSYDPEIPWIGVYLEKTLIQKDTYTPLFMEVLFTIAKTWKQPKEWIMKTWCIWTDKKGVVHIYTGILLSHKKNEIMPFAVAWMDPEIIILNEVRERQVYDITYLWNLKYDTNVC